MKLIAMLTVDLKNTDSAQRIKFNEELGKLNWSKLTLLTTIWTASFKEGVSEASAFNVTKDDVSKAAAVARISNYDLAVHFGEKDIFTYKK